ncbi:MAG: signal peptidase I [Verrucomicrobiaceae bacterium]
MFQPKYLKNAKLLHKGVTRFLNYKRDLLPQAKLDEINGLRSELEQAIKTRDSNRIDSLSETINRACERALPSAHTSALSENIEVFFVSIVIALGIRAYIAQPFQIPTGSMQPTLNGINAERSKDDPDPGIMVRALGWLTGTSYLNAVSDHDGYLDLQTPVSEHHFLIFRPYCELHFEDGHRLKINCPIRQLTDELRLYSNLRAGTAEGSNDSPDMRASILLRSNDRIHIKEGQILARGVIHNGDYVIVNKFAYHFRKPTRGEVFVFTTKNVAGIENRPDFDLRWGSQHYIKRLGGVPGDTLDVRSPELFINGKPAVEPGFRKVIDLRQPLEVSHAYHGYSPDHRIKLPVSLADQTPREYFALGDNSYNSSDSRYWGPVPEQNVVGPGLFCYWPLTSHWGVIR